MEQTEDLKHPSDAELAALGDPALAPAAQESLAVHLDSCLGCQARLEQMEPALAQYSRCLDAVHARVPRRRGRDTAFQAMMERLEPTRNRGRFALWQFACAGGVAASLIACVVLLLWSGHASELRAEALLAQAEATPVSIMNRPHGLRIRTQTASFVRPLPPFGLRGGLREEREAASVRAHFAEANYDWRDPLSPQSYSAWRHTLKHKTSKVSTPGGGDRSSAPQQQIETTTDEGTLRIASLMFDAKLAPVSGLFQFSDREWVEITALPAIDATLVDLVPAPVSAPSASGTSEDRPREPLAERELNVRLAVDTLHAGASEPIEVSAVSGDILVTTYHLTSEQQAKLESSLKQIRGVTLRALEQNTEEKQPGARLADRTGLVLQASQDVSFEAHFLAELDDRFSAPVEATLSEADRRKLWNLRMSHTQEMNRTLAKLQQKLQDAGPDFHLASGGLTAEPAGGKIQALADSASAVDRLIITLYASDDATPGRAAIWPQIVSEFGRLRILAQDYTRALQEKLKR